jgi:hypothetical protein
MTDPRDAWTDVGDRLSALALKLKLHAQEELSAEGATAADGLDKLRAVVSETMDALGDAYRDEAVRDDAREFGRSFIAAMDATSRAVQDKLRSQS